MPKLKTESAEAKTAGDLRPGSNAMMQLLSFVERLEHLDEERKGLGDDMKEVRDEAKGMGFDVATINKILSRRKKDSATVQESDALLELYEDTIRKAEQQHIQQSEADGTGPAESPTAPLRRGWGAKPAPEPVAEPTEDEVEETAAAEIAHAADHPEED